MTRVACPACGRSVEVDDAYRDWTVRCPHCEAEFVPDDVRPRAGRRRPRDEDDFDDEPYGGPAAAREEALRVVHAPALWLEICGWLSALGAIALTMTCMAIAAAINNNPPANQNDDPPELFAFMGCCMGVLGLPYGVAMAIGARKMRTLSSRGWAMTAAILGIASFALFGVFGLVQTGIGVWALVMLNNADVQDEFRRQSRRNRYD